MQPNPTPVWLDHGLPVEPSELKRLIANGAIHPQTPAGAATILAWARCYQTAFGRRSLNMRTLHRIVGTPYKTLYARARGG